MGIFNHSISRKIHPLIIWPLYTHLSYLRKMTDALTVGDAVLISEPTYSWETEGNPVNEGPGMFVPAVLPRK